jgi:hypothetical protein
MVVVKWLYNFKHVKLHISVCKINRFGWPIRPSDDDPIKRLAGLGVQQAEHQTNAMEDYNAIPHVSST